MMVSGTCSLSFPPSLPRSLPLSEKPFMSSAMQNFKARGGKERERERRERREKEKEEEKEGGRKKSLIQREMDVVSVYIGHKAHIPVW